MKKVVYQPLVLFDGVCNLCNSSVQYVIKHDRYNKFKFASLQSDAAKEILLQFNENNSDLNSIILIDNNKIFKKSLAVLRLLKILGGVYTLLYIFIIIPKPLRDWVYDYIAKNRYKWYGKKDSCMIPTKELKNKFID
jgi:predicted DCC family thiol-disulfide oxidoreductase YuxK|tara:strand:+ start:2454 stop:2864 length:411 start_codon:yes stop_codon:yes gene_type:complete